MLNLAVNMAFFAVGLVLAVVVLVLAARHSWLIAYGGEQTRIRKWMALLLVGLVLLSASAAILNLMEN